MIGFNGKMKIIVQSILDNILKVCCNYNLISASPIVLVLLMEVRGLEIKYYE